MEEHRPHQQPAYQTVYQVAVLTAFSVSIQLAAFDYFEFVYRDLTDSDYKYPIIGLLYGLSSFFGAVYGNVQAKRLKSCSQTAAQCCAMTIPLQIYWAYLARQENGTPTWGLVVLFVGLNAFGNAGLLTNTFGFVSKQCTQLTSGQQFGYIAIGFAFVEFFLFQVHGSWDTKFVTVLGVVTTLVTTLIWTNIDENETEWEEENVGTIWDNFWEHMPVALAGQSLAWLMEEQLQDVGYDQNITSAAWWVIIAAAVGGSVFAFGMDSKPNTLLTLWCVSLVLGFVGFYMELQFNDGRPDQRYLMVTVVLQQLARTGAFVLVLTKVAYNKNNVLNNISQWLAQWFVAWILVFCVLEVGVDKVTDENGLTIHLVVYGLVCLLAISAKFNVKWDAHQQKDLDVAFGTVDQNDNRQVGMEDF